MEEMRQHITYDSQGDARSVPSFMSQTPGRLSLNPLSMATTSRQKKVLAFTAGGIALIAFLVVAGVGLIIFFARSSGGNVGTNDNSQVTSDPSPGTTIVARQQVLIEGGTFNMGRNDVDPKDATWGDEYPAHTETVPSFFLDVYETTNAQYADFVTEASHKPPFYWENGKPPSGLENFPVTNVAPADANAYANWISKKESKRCRLPEEKEWEYAARNGNQNTKFPWGSEWKSDGPRLIGRDAVAVGTSDDTSLAGVKDMLGNVSEWTSTPYANYKGHPSPGGLPGTFVVRGLNFRTDEELLKKPERLVTYRQGGDPKDKDKNAYGAVGFRLVCEQ
jgi:formylglycine-generating enzyme required for sulfatase activity